jgi:hypothetical protein
MKGFPFRFWTASSASYTFIFEQSSAEGKYDHLPWHFQTPQNQNLRVGLAFKHWLDFILERTGHDTAVDDTAIAFKKLGNIV